MRFISAFLVAVLVTQPTLAWWESGHQIITVLAYDLLSKQEQQQVQKILKEHPRLAEDFVRPESETSRTAEDQERWLIGRAGYWPDVARSQPEYNRPTWHYQLGAALKIGDPRNVPVNPGPLPAGATMQTQELHIAQAIELCRSVLRDKSRPASDHALAICWLAHLVGDAHQPCHAGSLYSTKVFPEGDRGANSIPTKQAKNLHALWDSLLGDHYDAGDVRRRSLVIRSDPALWTSAEQAAKKLDGLNPLTWLSESSAYGCSAVYTPEVLNSIDAVERGLTSKLEMIELSETYLTAAGEVARARAAFAAHRLAMILSHDLK